MLTRSDITALFGRFTSLNVGVIGDFALDLYYRLQTRTGEQSLETGREVFWGSQPRASLGAAGNVVQNLHDLAVGHSWVVGCVGNDLFGREMQQLFQSLNVNTRYLHVLTDNWDTCLYTKPHQQAQELNRIDFGTTNTLSDARFADLLAGLEPLMASLDVLIINQQFPNPLLTKSRVAALNALIARFPAVRVIADMRDVGLYIRAVTLKVNTAELARFSGVALPGEPDLDWCLKHGSAFRQRTGGPLLITRGPAGMVYLDDHETKSVDGLRLYGELDTVGAGDTVVATWAACIGAGATLEQALELANMAAAVTVQKRGQTGSASLTEILSLYDIHASND